MKTISITSLLVFLFTQIAFTQPVHFEQHYVCDDFTDGYDVFPSDIDQDGDIDILACGKGNGGQLCWWENNGSNEFTQITLKQGFTGARSVRAADINLDGEIDILCAAWQANDIIYFKNNGNETFTEILVDDDFKGAHTVDIKDVDGDGWPDILCSGFDYYGHNGEIAWWQNGGQDSIIWTKHLVSDRFQQSPFVYGEDMDNDTDIDILACGEISNEIVWWENDGSGEIISENIVDDSFLSAHTVIAKDVDLDGDMDILGAGCINSKLAWYENDGNQQFARHNLTPVSGNLWLDAADFDNDGDNDLIAAGMSSGHLFWYENNGNQQFSRHQIVSEFPSAFAVVPVNMDEDGDMDLLAIGNATDRISWFENDLDSTTSIRSFLPNPKRDIKVFPNPCMNNINVEIGEIGALKNISLFTQEGSLVSNFTSSTHNFVLDLTGQHEGIYILMVTYSDKHIASRKIIKK